MVKDKDFYLILFKLALPVMVQNLFIYGLSLVDSVMLSHVDETAMNAAALGNQPMFIFSLFLFGIAGGAAVLSAQYWGRGDISAINSVMGISFRFSIGLALLFFCITLLAPEFVMRLYTSDSATVELGSIYLHTMCGAYIFVAVSAVYGYTLRSIGNVLVPSVINAVALLLNTGLNYILIFGEMKMGVRGAAVAMLTSRFFEMILLLLYAFFINNELPLMFKKIFSFNQTLFKDFMRYAMPVVFNEGVWGLGMTLHPMIISHLSGDGLAAYTISMNLDRLSFVSCYGITTASGVILGKMLGQGDSGRAYKYAKSALILNVFYTAACSSVLFILRPYALGFFNISDNAFSIAMQMLIVTSVLLPMKAFNMLVVVGILRSGGDTVFTAVLEIGVLWIISIPLGYLAAFVFNLPIYIVFLLLMSDEIIKIFIGLKRFHSKKWLNNITRETR